MATQQRIRRIGVLTGGGDCPGLNAVIRAVVKTAIGEFGWEVLGLEDGFDGLVRPDRARVLTADDVRGILPTGGTILGTTNRSNPFAYEAQTPRGPVVQDVSGRCLERIQEYGLDALVVIGGDGSLRIVLEFARLGVPVVGVPKTIDNDLSGTDVTFGFDTAVVTATEALDKLHTTAESHHRVMLLEVMGRNAGWIALHAGMAGGADVILIPELPFTLESVTTKIRQRDEMGRKFSIVVVSEGAQWEGQQIFQEHPGRDSSGIGRLGGVANCIGDAITQHTEHEVRVTVLGHLQRGGGPTAYDRILGSRFGAAAARMVAAGRFTRMAALRGQDIVDAPLEEAVGTLRTVPPDGELVRTARGLGICFG